MPTIPDENLPTPRIELRWIDLDKPENDGGFSWSVKCVYSLVIGLRDLDIRAEREDSEGRRLPNVTEMKIEIGSTRSTGRAVARLWSREDKVDTPFRDHSHALWDAAQLGNPPIYAIAAGRAMLVEPPSEETKG